MRQEPDIYGYLATSKVSDVTSVQINSSSKNSFVAKKNIDFWKGPITVHRIVEASRTYPHGLPIPELSAVSSESVAAEALTTIQPPSTEIWEIMAIAVVAAAGTPTVAINFFDGTNAAQMHSGTASTSPSSFFPWEANLKITNSGYIQVHNQDASNAITLLVGYHKVGL